MLVKRERRASGRWIWWLLAAVLLLAGASVGWRLWHTRQGPPDPTFAEVKPWFGPKTADAAIEAATVQIASNRERLAHGGKDWLRLEMLGDTLVGRYRLTGSYDDLAEGDKVLDEAIALAEYPGGPSLSRAALSATLHRLPDAEKALDRFAAQKGDTGADEKSSAMALRGDIAMQRGDYKAAREHYARAEDIANNAGLAMRQSMLALRTGNPELARRRVNAVLRGTRLTRQAKAAAALQRATIAYAIGDWATAGTWVRFADGFFPGSWLAQAFAAQQEAVEGRPDEAARRYAALAQRTNAPEVMDALAHLLRLQGKGAESRQWGDRAGAIWARRFAVLPEAAAAHVVEHELAVGDPRRALAIARDDATRRPHGATLAALARAQLLTGDPTGALATIERATAGGWSSSLLLLQKAEALDALGRGDDADTARKAALRINPHIADPAARFIWFGHD